MTFSCRSPITTFASVEAFGHQPTPPRLRQMLHVQPLPKPPPLLPTPRKFFAFASFPPQFRPQSKPLASNSQSFVAHSDSHTAAIGHRVERLDLLDLMV